MSKIKENLDYISKTLKPEVTLVAVTKTHSVDEINEAIENGVTDIGENKVQEILEKYDYVKPVKWHMIGHLQRNKVRQIIDKVDLIHSVDSTKLALEIDKRAGQIGKVIDVLVQINIGEEESKFGVGAGETKSLIEEILKTCPNVRIRGLMCVAPFLENGEEVRPFFRETKKQYDQFAKIEHPNLHFSYLSMGMSHDYQEAMAEGSNMVRVGSAIFGKRVY